MQIVTHSRTRLRLGVILLALLTAACAEELLLPPNTPAGDGGLRLEVQPLRAEGAPGDRVFLIARVVDARGQVQEGHEILWSQAAPGVATVSSHGAEATAYFRGIGTDTVWVESGVLSAQAVLTGVHCVPNSRNYPCN